MMLPYENPSITNLKGERWRDVPDYEGYYRVSNLGRVKSIDRIVPHPRLYEQFVKGRVLKQKVVKTFNKHPGDFTVSLQVAFTVEGATRFYNVRRLVFAAFKKRIDFKKDGLYVVNKNGDGYNNRISNLRLVSKAQKQQRSIKRGRTNFDYLKVADRTNWKKNYSRRKPVNQYSVEGTLINKYRSITEAHLTTGYDPKGISMAARGSYNGIWRGYKWVFPKDN